MYINLYLPEFMSALIAWAVIGLAIMAAGIWPRRRGETPYCRKCGYNLTGIASEHCPECGKTTGRRGTVFGLRKRKPLRILLGFLPICPLLGVAIYTAQNHDWYQHKPFIWVLSDFQASNTLLSDKAYDELCDRFHTKELSPAQVSAFIDANLAWKGKSGILRLSKHNFFLEDAFDENQLSDSQVDEYFRQIRESTIKLMPLREYWMPVLIRKPPSGKTGPKLIDLLLDFHGRDIGKLDFDYDTTQKYFDYLGECYKNEHMNESQKERFLKQISRWELEIRPWIVRGERLPFKLKQAVRCPSKPWAVAVTGLLFTVDDIPTPRGHFYSRSSYAHEGHTFPFFIERSLSVGKHMLEIEIPYQIGFEEDDRGDKFTPIYQNSVRLSKEFEVLDVLPENSSRLVADERLRKEITSSIEPGMFHYPPKGMYGNNVNFWGRIFVSYPPVDIAFDVFFKLGDVETKAGSLVFKTTSPREHFDYSIKVPEMDARTLDVIFRSSEVLVRESTDIFQAWDGEIVFANIPIAQSEDG